jgi:glycerophosphoryl diester phosphodiesterase
VVFIVGHRGGRNVWPENSIGGFEKVRALKIDAVEFDIHLTKAGELLCIHDATLERTTLSSGLVADLPLDGRKQVILRDSDGEHVPTFREVLEIFADTDFELHIEIKSDQDHKPYPGIVPAVIAELSRFSIGDRAVLTSFDPDVLREVRMALPDGRRLASIDRHSAVRLGGLASALSTLGEMVEIVAVERTLLLENLDLVKSIVPMNRWAVWMANEADVISYWLQQPVFSITSDRPDLAVSVKDKLRG